PCNFALNSTLPFRSPPLALLCHGALEYWNKVGISWFLQIREMINLQDAPTSLDEVGGLTLRIRCFCHHFVFGVEGSYKLLVRLRGARVVVFNLHVFSGSPNELMLHRPHIFFACIFRRY